MNSATRLEQQIAFIVEIDRLKTVLRQNYLADGSRRENTAEHSWHVSLMAMILSEHAAAPVDSARVLELLLVHDLVEIDAGDTFAYDSIGEQTKAAREQAAAERIFGLLPAAQAERLRAAWDEYEASETPEARFALSLDRLMPMIHNSLTEGRAWQANGVTADKVRHRAESIAQGAPALGALALELINSAVDAGFLASSPSAQ
ncbi:MAG: 5-nucleotidase [Proteobacteria bacterium]|nr:5-nucleotidase [Pseudomonadota bacterium]